MQPGVANRLINPFNVSDEMDLRSWLIELAKAAQGPTLNRRRSSLKLTNSLKTEKRVIIFELVDKIETIE